MKNIGSVDIEIFKQDLGGQKISFGILRANQQKTYEIPADTSVSFKNSSEYKSVIISISFQGSNNLTMG